MKFLLAYLKGASRQLMRFKIRYKAWFNEEFYVKELISKIGDITFVKELFWYNLE